LAAPLLRAQDAAADIQNSEFQAVGAINSNAVYVRSGASENDYATTKLDKGAQVTVVGERFNWLKIKPPEGTFCYVAQAYVNKAGNGSVGVVTSTLNVRVGSTLNPLKTKIAGKLEPGQRVEIIGEQDEYFKIKPPADVFVYVNKNFVDLVSVINPPQQPGNGGLAIEAPKPQEPSQTQTPAIGSGSAQHNSNANSNPVDSNEFAAGKPATQESAPTTQSAASAEAEFDKLEAQYAEITTKPLDEQPVEELLAGYQKLSSGNELPESLRRIAEWKASVLKTRADAKAQLVEVKQTQEDAKQKRMALKSEQAELEQRVKESDIKFFTAVGTLRTSSLQGGNEVLYRLTDPANGRTVVYIRSNDQKIAQMLGQFIGVKGDITNDAMLNIRVIGAANFEVVNPAKIGQNVAAQIAPPSLLPAGTASASE
jgi:uncharacterized protein YgiM (DUF1202 family)